MNEFQVKPPMSQTETVIFDGFDLVQFKMLCESVARMGDSVYQVRVTIDRHGMRYKVNEGLWSAPGGRME